MNDRFTEIRETIQGDLHDLDVQVAQIRSQREKGNARLKVLLEQRRQLARAARGFEPKKVRK